ncbi:TPA: prepilin peptidase [Campylobacter upsaliensis]|nr:prepilin peptidase [Campylobacter upsaliensis]HEC1550160.1 prepilin peptidase [Campylobacter upsaliensis]HEC1554041.1 prepilin peptidase [Campylobacter upsaliensis]HEC1565620.1 prepilin peptidase [Campylobacter upsaliensis]HEO8744394.1 prepilin peptidase [Campylobacter upsaliensis]
MENNALLWGILGAVLGSFCASFVSRICEKKPLFAMRSFCFSCEKKLTILELVPIFSYLFLKGRCKNCGVKIPLMCFLSEIFGIFLIYLALFCAKSFKEFLALTLFLFVCFSLSLIDLRLKAVPNFLLWIAFFCACLLKILESHLNVFDMSIFHFFIDAFMFAGFIFLLKSFISFIKNFKNKEVEENLGDADIILLAAFAGAFGFMGAFYVLFIAAFLSLPFFYFAFKKGEKELAFLPFISLAMCVYLVVGRIF